MGARCSSPRMTTTTPFSGPATATGTGTPSSVVIIEGTYAKVQPIGMRARGLGPQPTCDAGAPRGGAVEEAEDSIDPEMARQQVGDQMKLGVASRADAGIADNESAPAGRIGDTGESRATEVV